MNKIARYTVSLLILWLEEKFNNCWTPYLLYIYDIVEHSTYIQIFRETSYEIFEQTVFSIFMYLERHVKKIVGHPVYSIFIFLERQVHKIIGYAAQLSENRSVHVQKQFPS